MQKLLVLFFWALASCGLFAQTTTTFESFDLSVNTFLNGSDGNGGFISGNVFLPNSHNPAWDGWSGWAISTTTDTLTAGFTNQFSAITGGGYDGSTTYAISYASGGSSLKLEGAAAGGVVEGMYITNATYTYLSMLDGDGFAKKFGGETGNDPDFYLLTVKKHLNGELGIDSVDFYLADYRFSDNSQDYMIKDWTYLDLSSLGNADSLLFSLSSTDNNIQYGMNTPAYFCVDNITTADQVVSATGEMEERFNYRVFPNPATDLIIVDWKEHQPVPMAIFNTRGRVMGEYTIRQGENRLDISQFPRGAYVLQRVDGGGWLPEVIIRY